MGRFEKAREAGVEVRSGLSDYRTPCPKCSPDRRKKRDPCLHVTVLANEVRVHCFHCNWGMVFDDDQPGTGAKRGGGGASRSGAGAPSRGAANFARGW